MLKIKFSSVRRFDSIKTLCFITKFTKHIRVVFVMFTRELERKTAWLAIASSQGLLGNL